MKTIDILDCNWDLKQENTGLKILIFTEGTILGPVNLFQHFNHAVYRAIGNSAMKTKEWYNQGAQIFYMTSRRKESQAKVIAEILIKYGFAPGVLYYREDKEKYKDAVMLIKPDVLIEDDCRSIGGKWQMCITYVKLEIRCLIKSIVVKEFQGIDHLPSQINDLLKE